MQLPPYVRRGQAGDTLLSVLVAVALIGIAAFSLMQTASASLHAQQVVKLSGQKEDLRNVFRYSLVCEARCEDLLPSIPASIGGWDLRASCAQSDQPPVIETKNPKYLGGTWGALFVPGQERTVCRQAIVALPGSDAATGRPEKGRIVTCKHGEVVRRVDFAERSIECATLGAR
jgi:hypothetical protein